MKTYSAKASEIQREWHIVDATDLVLGRMASSIATIIRGKHKPTYTPSMDCGDNVIVINAEKVHLTGNKLQNKVYRKHTGYPGGLRETTAGKLLSGDKPEAVVKKAVERMISRNPLGRQQMRKLYVYAGSEHPHAAQSPKELDLKSRNDKNKKDR